MTRKIVLAVLVLLAGWDVRSFAQTNTEAVMTIGRNALYYEDYALSIQYFNQAIAAKPYLYAPYFYRAVAKYYLGDYNGAVDDCTMSISRDPYINEVYRLRAINYIRTDNYEEASRDYYTLINDRQSRDRDVWYNLVLCQAQLNQHSEADHLLDTMIVRWPDYARCYMLKAHIAAVRGDTVSADSLLVRTLSLDSTDVDAMSALAMLSLQRQQYERSESIYNQAITLSPRMSGLYINRALARYQQTNLRGAMEDYNSALVVAPDNYLAHYNRALLSMQVGENDMAIADFDFVLARRPNDRLALYNRAILAQQTGDYKRAIADYTTIIDEFPEFISAYVNRSYCYARVGENRRSEADNRKVLDLQLEHAYTKTEVINPLDTLTRDMSDTDIEDYDKLVTDESENMAPFYASEYRGRIQNRQVTVEYQPLYAMTFFKADNGLSGSVVRMPGFMEGFEADSSLYGPVYLSVREMPMTDAQCQDIDKWRQKTERRLHQSAPDVRLLFEHALYLSMERDYESAIQDLNQCLHLCQAADSIDLQLQSLYLRAYAKARLAEAQGPKYDNAGNALPGYTSAITDLTLAIQKDNRSAVLYYNRGTLYARDDEYQRAIENFSRAIELDPSMPEAYYNRGISYVKAGQKQQGIDDLSKAGEIGLFTAYSLIKQFRK